MPPNDFWTPERDKELAELYHKKTSMNEIGRIMGCSRNAAAGRIRRLKLSKSAQEGKTRPKTKKQPRQPRRKPSKPIDYTKSNLGPLTADKPKRRPKTTPPAPKPVKRRHRVRLPAELKDEKAFWRRIAELKEPKNDIIDIPGPYQCHYIYGDVKFDPDAHWCRKPAVAGKSWCAKHNKLFYNREPYKGRGRPPKRREWS